MKDMNQIAEMVFEELSSAPITRDSDRYLILYIYHDYYGITDESFDEVMRREDLPSFETIRRTRQKLQSVHPHLRAVKEVQDLRAEKRKEFYDFAVGGEI